MDNTFMYMWSVYDTIRYFKDVMKALVEHSMPFISYYTEGGELYVHDKRPSYLSDDLEQHLLWSAHKFS